MVGDVEMFPGHIACDAESKSEIVVPVIQNGEVSFFFAPALLFCFCFEPFGWLDVKECFFASSLMVYKEESFLADFRGAFGGKNRSSLSLMSIVPSKTPLTMKTKRLWRSWHN